MRWDLSCGRSVLVFAVFAAHIPSPVPAQQYSIARWSVGTLDPDPRACAAQVDVVRQTLVDFAASVSRQFAWIVLCDEKTWFHVKNLARYRRGATTTGLTDFRNHVVYINGFRKSAKDLRSTVGHEIGHQVCLCNDEDAADRVELALLASLKQVARK